MVASNYGQDRGDGQPGQVENISIGIPVEGHSYNGKVKFFSTNGPDPVSFLLMFSGVDSEGVLHVYGSEAVAEFGPSGSEHPYSLLFSNDTGSDK